jgi:cytochrome c-type biogenesis protein CcsB
VTNSLDGLSVLLLLSAMAVYAVAFVAFALDLARRGSEAEGARPAAAAGSTAEASSAGGVAVLTRPAPPLTRPAPPAVPPVGPRGRKAGRIGVSLTILGFALHLGADVLRGVAAARVPWANMYEFAMTGTLIIVGLFLLSLTRVDLRFLGSVVTGLVLVLLGIATVGFRVAVSPLPPALQSYWLVIHVLVAIIATGFFTLSGALSAVQLLQSRRERVLAGGGGGPGGLRAAGADAARLENLAYRVAIVGFILWTFTLIAGAIWANHAWGRYWGWDTKEVWTFIIWVI